MALSKSEQRVQPATKALLSLYGDLLDDLDAGLGGFGWWHGHVEVKRLVLISEYLAASTHGLNEALLSSAHAVDTFQSRSTADTHWLRACWKSLRDAKPNYTDEDFLRSHARGPVERRRDHDIDGAVEHAFFHLAQAMDRLSACVIGVAGLHVNILKADWSHMRRAIEAQEGGTSAKILQALGTPARSAQDDIIANLASAIAAGPNDWLPWMLRQRDTIAHRAPKVQWQFVVNDRQAGDHIATPFYVQPGWSEVEAMVRTGQTRKPTDLLIMEEPSEILNGFLETTTTLIADVIPNLRNLWVLRRLNPLLIIQPETQWPDPLETPPLNFPGFGTKAIKVSANRMYVNPANAKRMKASKVLDDDNGFWK